MSPTGARADVVIVGAGLAGLVTAYELLDLGRRVVVLDRDIPRRAGGLARESFGGIFVVDSPQQRRAGIRDSPELALADWASFAEHGPEDVWPKRWAEAYTGGCRADVYDWLVARGIRFVPMVQWLERGLFRPGNSVPRFHLVWGTGWTLVETLLDALRRHPSASLLELRFQHRVSSLETRGGAISGVSGTDEESGGNFRIEAEHVVIASGGICGDIDRLRTQWCADWGDAPATILNGSHRYANGELHDEAARKGAVLTHLDKQWSYAAGVHHPHPDGMPDKGLSLVPPRSALWLDSGGERIGPVPLVTGYDTRFLVQQIATRRQKYSWQVMNMAIAKRELAVSGSAYNDAMRERRRLAFVRGVLLGNEPLVRRLIDECRDFVVADSLDALVARMNALEQRDVVSLDAVRSAVESYDATIDRGPSLHNDEQLRRIAHLRQWRGDRIRTCRFQKIVDPGAMPLIAVRQFILSRKSLGGIRTDLDCRVLGHDGAPIPGLLAVGEAAGFGGGGVHGLRALEGTFLGSCILTGRRAGRSIAAS